MTQPTCDSCKKSWKLVDLYHWRGVRMCRDCIEKERKQQAAEKLKTEWEAT